MAVVIEDYAISAGTDDSSPKVVSVTGGTNADRAILLIVSYFGGTSSPSNPTVNGNATTLLLTLDNISAGGKLWIYQGLAGIVDGANSISVVGGQAPRLALQAYALSGVLNDINIISSSSGQDGQSCNTGNLATITPDGLCIDAYCVCQNATVTIDASATLSGEEVDGIKGVYGSSFGNGLTSFNLGVTGASDNRVAHMAMSFKPSALSGPVFTDPSPIDNKVGDTISLDANDWFTTSGGLLTNWLLVNQSTGITIDNTTGLITGTADVSTIYTVDVTCTDDNGTTTGTFTWNVDPYRIEFTGSTRLEDQDGSPISTTGVGYSVWQGFVADVSGAPLLEENGKTITSGVLTIDLPDGETVATTYSVFMADTDEASTLPLATYQISSS